MKHTFGELFAGVGGFGMGMETAGWECAWQVEWDKQCQQVLRHHWPTVPKYGDVTTVNGYDLVPVDCITFGSPCQDLSVAGKRAGLDGNRSGLFFEAIRIIKEMRDATQSVWPRWAIWENVVGALSSNHGHDFAAVLDSLAEAGAVAIEWAVLDAQHFGVPQRRRRVFVVACFDPATAERCPDPLLPVAESLPRDTAKKRTAREGVATALTKGLGTGGPDSAHALAGWLVPEVVNAPTDDVVAKTSINLAWGIRADAVREGVSKTPSADASGQVRLRDPGLGISADLSPTIDSSQPHIVAYVVNAPTDDVVGTLSGGGIQARTTGRTPTADCSYPSGVVSAVTSKWAKGTGGPSGDECQNLVAVWTKAKRAQSVDDDETWVEGVVAPTLNAFDQGDTRATVLAVAENQRNEISLTEVMGSLGSAGGSKPGGQGTPTVLTFGHLEQPWTGGSQQDQFVPLDGVAPTLAHSSNSHKGHHQPKVLADAAVRRLTPVECERLMGWPDNHTATGVTDNGDLVQLADSPRYRMIGNGVASPVAAWIGRHLFAVDGAE